ncbi:MAG TPA: hypothetical protein VLW17_14170 [Thermoanaerobaculaceae bacterium]|nr:hypothetical protein [Thermoanaerobaculaceae bacterium]
MARSRWTGVAGVALTACLAWAALLAADAHFKFGGDPRGLLFVGRNLHHPPALAGVPRCGAFGYDGQFYAALAADPWLRSEDTLRSLDAPGYRAGRILLPMLAWALALGSGGAAVVAYQALCWTLALAAIVLVAAWLRGEGASPWWALLLLPNAGLVTSMLRSTPDAAAAALVVAMLLLHRGRRHGAGAGVGALATLARETSLLAALAVALDELLRGERRRALAYLAAPLLAALAWQGWIETAWHPNYRLPASLALPFVGLGGKLAATLQAPALDWQELWAALAAALTVAGIAAVLARRWRGEAAAGAYLAFAALAVILAGKAYADAYASSRALVVAPFLAVALAARPGPRWARALLLAGPVAFGLAGLAMLRAELGPWLPLP